MTFTSSDVKIEDTIFSADCGYDSKHINNLSDKPVSEDILRAVEAGCSLETLETLAAGFPVCKYKTQITIHGLFPALATNRIGGYVNLVQNKNKSVGVRWTAVDHEKKSRLFKTIRKCTGMGIVENSTTFHMEKFKFLKQDNRAEVIAQFRAMAERVDKSLFIGDVEAFVGKMPMIGEVAVFRLGIRAFRAENFDAIVQNVSGLDAAGVTAALAAYEAKRAAERAEMERQHAEWERKAAESEARRKAENDAWLAANPPADGYAEETDTPSFSEGDMIALPASTLYHGPFDRWDYYRVGKSFGKLTAFPCNADGSKITGWDRSHKGTQVDRLAVRGKRLFVKREARPSVPVRPAAAVPFVSRPAATVGTATATVTENPAKNGIEIRFAAKPSADILAGLKANGWRWSKFGGCWYNRVTEASRAYAARFSA